MSMSSSEGLAGPSRPQKRAHRAVKSCGFCYRHKVRCDQSFPCSRCVKRGIGELCQQETSLVNGTASHSRSTRREPTYAELVLENKSLHRKLASLARPLESESRIFAAREGQSRDDMTRETIEMSERDLTEAVREVRGLGQSLADSASNMVTDPSIPATLDLIPRQLSDYLVHYHCESLHWVHCVFHKPTFTAEYHRWMDERTEGTGGNRGYDFLALYFSVIATSLYFVDRPIPGILGISTGTLELLPRFWFDTAIKCLHLSGFIARPTLAAIQAICVMPLIGFTMWASQPMQMLLHIALGVTREFGFHALVADTPATIGQGSLERELGRRIWACVCVAESLDATACAPLALVYPESRSDLPTNVDDIDIEDGKPLVAIPGDHYSDTSHLAAITRLSRIFRSLVHSLAAISTPVARWHIVQEHDSRMIHVLDSTPALDPDLPPPLSAPAWIYWSRFTWKLRKASARIMIYREFLARGYKDEAYTQARTICVSQARLILAAWTLPRPALYTKTWPITTDTILAGIVLATEAVRDLHSPSDRLSLRNEVRSCIDILTANSDSTNAVVPRGVAVLEKMLQREQTAHDTRMSAAEQEFVDWDELLSGLATEDDIGATRYGADPGEDMWATVLADNWWHSAS